MVRVKDRSGRSSSGVTGQAGRAGLRASGIRGSTGRQRVRVRVRAGQGQVRASGLRQVIRSYGYGSNTGQGGARSGQGRQGACQGKVEVWLRACQGWQGQGHLGLCQGQGVKATSWGSGFTTRQGGQGTTGRRWHARAGAGTMQGHMGWVKGQGSQGKVTRTARAMGLGATAAGAGWQGIWGQVMGRVKVWHGVARHDGKGGQGQGKGVRQGVGWLLQGKSGSGLLAL